MMLHKARAPGSYRRQELSLCGLTVLDRNLWSNFALIKHLLGLRIQSLTRHLRPLINATVMYVL